MQEKVLELLSVRRGHFLLESGHHGDVWLNLESLCLHPRRVQSLVVGLAEPLLEKKVDVVCAPLVEGAFVGLMVALRLGTQFVYAERLVRGGGVFPVEYRVPVGLREGLRGRRVAIVDDVINAGSAVRSTFAELDRCGAVVVDISALLVLGDAGVAFAGSKGVPLRSLGRLENNLWVPGECPLCAKGVGLVDASGGG